jgi:hypothetical protein
MDQSASGPRPTWNQDPHLLLFRKYAKDRGRKASASGLYVVENGPKRYYVGVDTRMSPLRPLTRKLLQELSEHGLSAWTWSPLDGFKPISIGQDAKSFDPPAPLRVVK